MAKPSPAVTTNDLGARLAEVAGMLDRAVAVLNQTLTEIKSKEEVEGSDGQPDAAGADRSR